MAAEVSENNNEKEFRILLEEYRVSNDSRIRNKIVKLYLPFVEKLAKSYSRKYTEQFEDLFQVGCLGLNNALDKFDLKQKVSFKTYSSHFIIGEMKHYIRDHGSLVKLPRELQELSPKVSKARQFLFSKTGEDATPEQISEYLGIPLEKVKQTLEMEILEIPISLDHQYEISSSDDDARSLLEQLEDKKYRSFQLAQEDRIIVGDAIKEIKDQSRKIIEYAFYQDLSQTEIAIKLGLSQMQVSRKMKESLKELWKILNKRVTPW